MAIWYRLVLPVRGWKLLKSSGAGLQMWLRPEESRTDRILMLRFEPGEFTTHYLYVYDDIPTHPDAVMGDQRCPLVLCQVFEDSNQEQIDLWFAEYLGYLGWKEAATDLYEKDGWQVRLEYQTVPGGIAVTHVKTFLPPRWGPTPTPRAD